MNAQTIHELKAVLATVLQVRNTDSQLFPALPAGAFLGALAVFQLAAWTVYLALADTGLLVDQQDLSIPDYKYERGKDLALPRIPVNIRQVLQTWTSSAIAKRCLAARINSTNTLSSLSATALTSSSSTFLKCLLTSAMLSFPCWIS